MVNVLFFGLLWSLFLLSGASYGDRTNIFQECKKNCVIKNCTKAPDLERFYTKQPLNLKLTLWDCPDECRYMCMWVTVEVLKKLDIATPQFFGKWPFVRVFGIEEPASAFASLLNLITYFYGTMKFIHKVPYEVPMFKISLTMGLLAINTWTWSTVFHTRDFNFTEKMDYFSAIILVAFGSFTCICRLSYGLEEPKAEKGRTIRIFAFVILFVLTTYHISYLTFVHFDYGYNMMANVFAGLMSVILWLFYHWRTHSKYTHQWKGSMVMILASLLILLEIADFPPIYWILDAHALWHFSTVPLPIFWMAFLADDAIALNNSIRYKIA